MISSIQFKIIRQFYLKFVFVGIVGDWKSSFTAADNEKFDLVFKEKMKDSKLKILFS